MDVNQNLVWVAVIIAVLMIGSFLLSEKLTNRVADQVIEKLQKNYTPGPYAPGFDPDKVNPNVFRNQPPVTNFALPPTNYPYVQPDIGYVPTPKPVPWEQQWDQLRN